jgi:hypothetical protein
MSDTLSSWGGFSVGTLTWKISYVRRNRKMYPPSSSGSPLGKYQSTKYKTVTRIAPGISERMVEVTKATQP